MTTKTWMMTFVLASAIGCSAVDSDDLSDTDVIDDMAAKADIGGPSVYATWENLDNSGDYELQYLQLKRTLEFDAQRWNIDYCPDDDAPSTCSEDYAGTFTLKKTSAGKKVMVLDEGATTTRYYYEIQGTTLKLHEAGVSSWTRLTRI